jgi:hypothetical protein
VQTLQVRCLRSSFFGILQFTDVAASKRFSMLDHDVPE